MDVSAVQSTKGKGKGSHKVCSHCGKSGHAADTCYELVGYPTHKGAKGKAKGKGKNNQKGGSDGGSTRSSSISSQSGFKGKCHYCHETGRTASECPKKAVDKKKKEAEGGVAAIQECDS
eukprot:505022-Alexandrium_andersonii.AAC.1